MKLILLMNSSYQFCDMYIYLYIYFLACSTIFLQTLYKSGYNLLVTHARNRERKASKPPIESECVLLPPPSSLHGVHPRGRPKPVRRLPLDSSGSHHKPPSSCSSLFHSSSLLSFGLHCLNLCWIVL